MLAVNQGCGIMNIIQVKSIGFASNCYIIGSGCECAVVDPSANEAEITAVVGREGLTVKYILLTHAHFDHMLFLENLREKTGAPLCVHSDDALAMSDPDKNLFSMMSQNIVFAPPEKLLYDGDTLPLGAEKIRVMHTPGHTPGSVCYYCGGEALTGDTLFDMSVGRTDFPGGDEETLKESIKKLYSLPDSTKIYPGHGEPSTIGIQRSSNPYTKFTQQTKLL